MIFYILPELGKIEPLSHEQWVFYLKNLIPYKKILARGTNFRYIHGKKKSSANSTFNTLKNLQLFKHENVHTIIITKGV